MAKDKKLITENVKHPLRGAEALILLESVFGNDGYAFWFKLFELLIESVGHSIDCMNLYKWRLFLLKMKVEEGRAREMLDLLIGMGEMNEQLWEEKKIITLKSVDDYLKPFYKRKGLEYPLRGQVESSLAVKSENGSAFDNQNSGLAANQTLANSSNHINKEEAVLGESGLIPLETLLGENASEAGTAEIKQNAVLLQNGQPFSTKNEEMADQNSEKGDSETHFAHQNAVSANSEKNEAETPQSSSAENTQPVGGIKGGINNIYNINNINNLKGESKGDLISEEIKESSPSIKSIKPITSIKKDQSSIKIIPPHTPPLQERRDDEEDGMDGFSSLDGGVSDPQDEEPDGWVEGIFDEDACREVAKGAVLFRDGKVYCHPSFVEIDQYCRARGNAVDADEFYDYYNERGWKVGSEPMRDWHSVVQSWERRIESKRNKSGMPIPPGVKLGVGEFIRSDGKRSWGTGQHTVPMSAPPRPGDRYYWNYGLGQWNINI